MQQQDTSSTTSPQDAHSYQSLNQSSVDTAQTQDYEWATKPSNQKPAPRRTPTYVRERTPHKTQGVIDDLNDPNEPAQAAYTHDSNISVGGGAFSGGRAYRRARNDKSGFGSGQYGQYLEVPKGRRSIFSAQGKTTKKRNTLLIGVVVIALILMVILVLYFTRLI